MIGLKANCSSFSKFRPMMKTLYQAISVAIPGLAFALVTTVTSLPLRADEQPASNVAEHTVKLVFAEPLSDPSENLLLTWSSTSDKATVLEYQFGGADAWRKVESHRTRPFPGVDGLHLHTAALRELKPDTAVQLRFPGATRTDSVKTTPDKDVRLVVASDYQNYDFSDTSPLALFGKVTSGMECDLLLFAGDFVNDNGITDPKMGDRWLSFMSGLDKHWRRDGSLIPILGVFGNHEGRNIKGTGSASWHGNGTPGPMVEIFSLGYDPQGEAYVDRGLWSCGIGKELFLISLETDHTVPLSSQVGWLEEKLKTGAANYRHIIVTGHTPAYYVQHLKWEVVKSQAGTLRSLFWPLMQNHADKVRGYFCGHEHRLTLTERLLIEPGSDDASRVTVDPARGIRQIGSGTAGGRMGPLNRELTDRTANGPEGKTPIFRAVGGCLMDKPSVFETHGHITTEGAANMHNVWIADFSETGFHLKAVGHNGHVFCEISEPVK